MKAIILLAGLGTRLRPHTYSRPKPLVNVAGKPVLGHILDGMAEIQFEEIIFIVGYLGDQIEKYVATQYPHLNARFVVQEEMRGQAHAINLARDHIDQEVLIIFGDTIWETDWSRLKRVASDGLIYCHQVPDPRRFGVVTLDNGFVTRFVEKPQTPISNLAVVGVYYFKAWQKIMQAIDDILTLDIQTKGEYYLADAMQRMIEQGARLEAEPISVWEDCGTREAILQTNRYLLGKNGRNWVEAENSHIIPPVYVGEGAQIRRSIIGPNVSISEGAVIEDAILRDCIISEYAEVKSAMLESSLIGSNARVYGTFRKLNVGDSPNSIFRIKKMRVETYSSFAYAVAPRALELENSAHRVTEIARQWRTPGHIHFYVRDEKNDCFELTYDETNDAWTSRAFGKNCPTPNKVKTP